MEKQKLWHCYKSMVNWYKLLIKCFAISSQFIQAFVISIHSTPVFKQYKWKQIFVQKFVDKNASNLNVNMNK